MEASSKPFADLFLSLISSSQPSPEDVSKRRWIYIPYDRYTDRSGPLTEQPPEQTGIIIVESTAKAHRRPYHKKKLILLISNMRHFALEQAQRGVKVLYHFSPLSHGQALLHLQQEQHLSELTVMEPAERELRLDLAQAVEDGLNLHLVPDTTWLSTSEDFLEVYGPYIPGKKYVMDRFYRRQRLETGILVREGKPVGAKFSHDASNRLAYDNEVPVPSPPRFSPDAVTQEVISYVNWKYAHHFGSGEGFDQPCTQAECDHMWQFALRYLLPYFGPFEDAMRDDKNQLFHSRTSALVNLARLLPSDLVRDVEADFHDDKIPLASAEGFIRQLLGWREFMRHIHAQTDGYRLAGVPTENPGRPQETSPDAAEDEDPYSAVGAYAGAYPNALHASLPLPAVYWGVKSGFHCVDSVVAQVWDEGWSHHITRLMVLANLTTLCGFSPRELTDWFWMAYVDAYDWVVEPNVLGMGTYADGGITATKPYVSGAAYINRMSNFCGHCRYDPKRSTGDNACPFTALYWIFLERNEATLGKNFRLQMPYKTLHKKTVPEMIALRKHAAAAITHLQSFGRPRY